MVWSLLFTLQDQCEHNFKEAMKLEAVNPLSPENIHVATVTKVKGQYIWLSLEGELESWHIEHFCCDSAALFLHVTSDQSWTFWNHGCFSIHGLQPHECASVGQVKARPFHFTSVLCPRRPVGYVFREDVACELRHGHCCRLDVCCVSMRYLHYHSNSI